MHAVGADTVPTGAAGPTGLGTRSGDHPIRTGPAIMRWRLKHRQPRSTGGGRAGIGRVDPGRTHPADPTGPTSTTITEQHPAGPTGPAGRTRGRSHHRAISQADTVEAGPADPTSPAVAHQPTPGPTDPTSTGSNHGVPVEAGGHPGPAGPAITDQPSIPTRAAIHPSAAITKQPATIGAVDAVIGPGQPI